MATVLGVSAHYHDAAACLVRDGHVVAAVQQERLSRVKHDASFPREAIAQCLRIGDVDGRSLDKVLFYENPFQKLERVMRSTLSTFPHGLRGFVTGMAQQLTSRIWVMDALRELLGTPRDRVECVTHHQSHAASAYHVSGADHAAVLVVDGVGEHETTTIWQGRGDALSRVDQVLFPDSLGLFYAAVTAFLGFRVNEGEFKVMGLSAYGTPRLRDAFAALITLDNDGGFVLDRPAFLHMVHPARAFGPAFEKALGPARPHGARWQLSTKEDAHYADVAATAQAILEDALLGLARRAHRLCDSAQTLCLAGGVALNVRAVRRLVDEGPFERVFVAPAAGDAGGAMGAALLGALAMGDDVARPMKSAALGAPADAARAMAVAEHMGFCPRWADDPAQEAARVLERGGVLALCTGRAEWGPRALGHRSLLAKPEDAGMKDRVNAHIKKREMFRPLAPVTLPGSFDTFFEGRHEGLQQFMTVTNRATPQAKKVAPAALHVDGTARAQCLVPEQNTLLAATLEAMDAPILLNTSLNAAGEPICDSAEDALLFLLRHRIDALLVEDVLIERKRP